MSLIKQTIYAIRPTYAWSYSRPWLDIEQYEDTPWYSNKEDAERKLKELESSYQSDGSSQVPKDVELRIEEHVLLVRK